MRCRALADTAHPNSYGQRAVKRRSALSKPLAARKREAPNETARASRGPLLKTMLRKHRSRVVEEEVVSALLAAPTDHGSLRLLGAGCNCTAEDVPSRDWHTATVHAGI